LKTEALFGGDDCHRADLGAASGPPAGQDRAIGNTVHNFVIRHAVAARDCNQFGRAMVLRVSDSCVPG